MTRKESSRGRRVTRQEWEALMRAAQQIDDQACSLPPESEARLKLVILAAQVRDDANCR